MKIGLISDTHVPSMGKEPPHQVIPAFEGVELILHAGDIYTQDCIEWLERIAPVKSATSFFATAVEAGPRVSPPAVYEIEGRKIGLVHKLELQVLGDDVWPGALDRYPASKSIADDLRGSFGENVEIVVCGYTHEPMVETHQGILFINPGSPNMVKQSMKLGHVGILELTATSAEARILDLADYPAE
ncbi:MAG: metallophosphatase family protein [Dehalococcoidia bacterium]|mgnify:CR=1 FL=1|nr:metallophosphatase family protein [Dehalococcoidia bacterium]